MYIQDNKEKKDWSLQIVGGVCFAVVAIIVITMSVVLTNNKNNFNNNNPPGQNGEDGPGAEEGETCADTGVVIGREVREQGDYIGLIFTECPSPAAFEAFKFAATRWSDIIVQNRITPIEINEPIDTLEICGPDFPARVINFPDGLLANRLRIFAENIDIDGVNGILAQAGFCDAFDDNNFPLFGTMQFDNADLAILEQDGTIDTVILHEMGHVLGIGTLWSLVDLDGNFIEDFRDSLLPNPVFDPFVDQLNPDQDPNNIQTPLFIGLNGIREFNTLTGVNNNQGVPVEDGSGQFDVVNGEGRGSVDGHWDIDTFDQELMVFAIDPNVADHPLSRQSIGSLTDLGYGVNANLADDFALPARNKKNLRKSIDMSKVHSLKGDIRIPKPGRAVRSEKGFIKHIQEPKL